MLTERNLELFRNFLSSSAGLFSAFKLFTFSRTVLFSIYNLKRGKTESYQREIKISI